jgi:hypothetical protein
MLETDEAALEELRGRVTRWRAKHGGRGKRLPDWVWAQAGSLAPRVGVDGVAQALKLRVDRLAAFADLVAPGEITPAGPSGFVELAPGMVLGDGSVVAEIELRGSVRARVRGGDPDVVARVLCRLIEEDRRCSR